jgi:hypothetical protein
MPEYSLVYWVSRPKQHSGLYLCEHTARTLNGPFSLKSCSRLPMLVDKVNTDSLYVFESLWDICGVPTRDSHETFPIVYASEVKIIDIMEANGVISQ